MKLSLSVLFSALLFSTMSPAFASCSLKTAQEKMMAVNNMAQVYNRQIADYMEKGEEAPLALHKKQEELADASSQAGIMLAAQSEENPSLGYEDEIDASICSEYEKIMAEYAPAGYEATPINRQDTTSDPDCNQTKLWERFGVSMQKQVELTQAGKIDDQETAQYMRLTSELGEYSTTDLSKACELQTSYEDKLANE